MELSELGCLWIQGKLKAVLGSERPINAYRGRWRRPAVGSHKVGALPYPPAALPLWIQKQIVLVDTSEVQK